MRAEVDAETGVPQTRSPREWEKYWLHDTDTWLFDGPGSPSFFCSPLSCNGMAEEYPVNRYCLVDDPDTALAMARDFATGNCEPGPYCVVEVWMQKPRRRGEARRGSAGEALFRRPLTWKS